ncbi:MAG: alpha/beta fold hydrolase [Gammaproteobacteria bacterium]
MMHKTWLKITLFCLFCLFSLATRASDTAKEKRWADQIVDSIMVGDAEWLTVGKQKVLALYSEQSTEKPRGGAIVLHGIGAHPNWDQIVRPVRSQLPDHGWSTLSVQMPILPNDAKQEEYVRVFDEVAPRMNAAVKFLKDKGINNIVIVAHSLGSAMAAYYLREKPDSSVKALVAIGATGSHFKDTNKNYVKSLNTIKVPAMDIFGANDLPDVLKSADERLAVARKAGNKHYSQTRVPGADHFFNGKQDVLIKHILDWIKKYETSK